MDHPREAAERCHDSFYLVSAHLPPSGRGADLDLRGYLLRLDLGDPRTDHYRVSPGVKAGPVAGELAVVVGDAGQGGCCPCLGGGVFELPGLLGELGHGRVDCLRGEQFREPVIDAAEHVGLFDVDGLGVVNAVGQGVLGGEPASVVDLIVVYLGAHPTSAQAAVQDAAQGVGTRPAVRLVLGLAAAPGEHRLGVPEVVLVEDLRVRGLVRADPLVFRVPPLLGGVPERDVLNVEQDFVGTLPVPHLVAGVARVGQDGADGALGPGDAVPVGVALRVVRRRAEDTVPRQAFGNGEDAAPSDQLGEDPLDHVSRLDIENQRVHPLAVCGLRGVGVRSRVREQVAVRRAPAEEPPFDLRLRGHGGADADLDPVSLALAHPAEHRHHQVVRLVGRVDRPADLGHPQRYPVMVEDRESEPVLIAVERAVRLADHHRIELAGRVLEFGEQRGCLGTALPRDRAGLVHVEELGDDLTAARLDQRAGPGELPAS